MLYRCGFFDCAICDKYMVTFCDYISIKAFHGILLSTLIIKVMTVMIVKRIA